MPEKTCSTRCPWCTPDPLYIKYHDREWGKVVKDDYKLFELLLLEGAQAGLSWLTVLRKRENYRKAFYNFDFYRVSEMSAEEEELLMHNEGIVRNRLKIHAAIINAKLFPSIIREFGSFYDYVLTFLPDKRRIVNDIAELSAVPAKSEISDALSKDLKKRGFKFVGSTICYAFLQAAGFIDDHLNSCPSKNIVRRQFVMRGKISYNRQSIIRYLQSTEREGIANIIGYMEDNNFFEVPSSYNRHHNWRGGLAEHSLGVLKIALRYGKDRAPRESIILAALLHDICKVRRFYIDCTGRIRTRAVHIPGHGSRSIKIIEMLGVKLTEDERLAIRWHMGSHPRDEIKAKDRAKADESELWKIISHADRVDAKKGKRW